MNSPQTVYYAIAGTFDSGNLASNVVLCIMFTYYCSTFFVYIATGQIFRKEARNFFTNIKCKITA